MSRTQVFCHPSQPKPGLAGFNQWYEAEVTRKWTCVSRWPKKSWLLQCKLATGWQGHMEGEVLRLHRDTGTLSSPKFHMSQPSWMFWGHPPPYWSHKRPQKQAPWGNYPNVPPSTRDSWKIINCCHFKTLSMAIVHLVAIKSYNTPLWVHHCHLSQSQTYSLTQVPAKKGICQSITRQPLTYFDFQPRSQIWKNMKLLSHSVASMH